MKKYILIFWISIVACNQTFACGGDYDPDTDYYNLFMQEIINDPQYYPFLLTFYNSYYESKDKNGLKNENIEEWQRILGITYEEAYYLVYKATESDLRLLIDGKSSKDKQLSFVTIPFVQKHKQSLLYLAYAKRLEPYMSISKDPNPNADRWWSYYSETDQTADKLDYKKTMSVLQKSWNIETDKDLKLRYGYQMVRLAHYTRKYSEAIELFNTYVESLHYKPVFYYYALNQKAGAERGVGDFSAAMTDFLQVIAHSKNLKENAFNSLRLGGREEFDYNELIGSAKTVEEKNNAYLLLGYLAFSNPLNEIEKIVIQSPDAIQAKVLMARAVNFIERDRLSINPYFSYFYYNDNNSVAKFKDKRYPLMEENQNMAKFLKSASDIANKMVERKDVKDKNFWYFTTAYLKFLDKDFASAKKLLEKVQETDKKYASQKKNLTMFIDICEQPKITNEVENRLYSQYKGLFNQKLTANDYSYENSTLDFVLDVLANRYFLQKDYAKSFLLNNDIKAIQRNPQLSLLNEIEIFFNKKKKNEFEQYIIERMSLKNNSEIQDFIHTTRGLVYLAAADFDQALASFKQVTTFNYLEISNSILGYNKIECFNCEEQIVMENDYLNEFSFPIHTTMNPKELAEVLVNLRKETLKPGEAAAKANYLIGNFFYNTSLTGYYRNYLRFSSDNGYNYSMYYQTKKPDIYDNIYFKYYDYYYDNAYRISQQYLEKAYTNAHSEELKARIAFALSKCEQEEFYENNRNNYYSDGVWISGRPYFKELAKYKGTRFYHEVKTNCSYFDYYISHL